MDKQETPEEGGEHPGGPLQVASHPNPAIALPDTPA